MTQQDQILAAAEWDTKCFGFPVGRVTSEATALSEGLALAKQRRFRLVYWSSLPDVSVPNEVLGRYSGVLIDRKVTFGRALHPQDLDAQSPCDFIVCEHPQGPASEALVNLALAAGVYSRFRLDPRFPRRTFEKLYRTWIERSARREIADAVLTIAPANERENVCGMATVTLQGIRGAIGLIAVDERMRGRGFASALLRAVHAHLVRRGCERVLVTTQLDNVAACRLYARAGYEIDTVQNVYHFWPLAS